jgi:hypothetical protein
MNMTKYAVIAIVAAALAATAARAEDAVSGTQTLVRDAKGDYAGTIYSYGRTQTYVDRAGHFAGSAINQGNGTTSFFNRNGQLNGSAGSSIDRAFNFNRR